MKKRFIRRGIAALAAGLMLMLCACAGGQQSPGVSSSQSASQSGSVRPPSSSQSSSQSVSEPEPMSYEEYFSRERPFDNRIVTALTHGIIALQGRESNANMVTAADIL